MSLIASGGASHYQEGNDGFFSGLLVAFLRHVPIYACAVQAKVRQLLPLNNSSLVHFPSFTQRGSGSGLGWRSAAENVTAERGPVGLKMAEASWAKPQTSFLSNVSRLHCPRL